MREESQRIYSELCEVIPAGVNSPVRAFPGLDETPLVIESAQGALLMDVDGREYIDYCCSWGAVIHGHAARSILEKAEAALLKGTSYGITTPIEGKIARLVVERVPSIEMVRFVSSGTEATMSAIRLARGYTGRDIVVKFTGNYHGHADHLLVDAGSGVTTFHQTSSSAGVPDDFVRSTISIPYNDVNAVKKVFGELGEKIACVIVEPIAGNMGCVPGTKEFHLTLREETERVGAVLIWDEVINGFRISPGGAQQLYGITPDLTCLAKVIGGGFPVAAFGGKKKIMGYISPLGPVYQAGTLSGNPVAMAAGLAAIEPLDDAFFAELERKARIVTDPVGEALASKGGCVQRVGSMFTLFFGRSSVSNMEEAKECDLNLFKRFFHAMLAKGIYIPPSQFESWFVSAAHTDEQLKTTRDVILEFVASL